MVVVTRESPDGLVMTVFLISNNPISIALCVGWLYHSPFLQRNPFSDVFSALNSVSDDAVFKKNSAGFYEYSSDGFSIQTDARGNIVSLKTQETEFTFT